MAAIDRKFDMQEKVAISDNHVLKSKLDLMENQIMQRIGVDVQQRQGLSVTDRTKSDFIYTSHEMKLNELEAKIESLRQ